MKKQKSLNNKGFSLVELIIVIAIMAILTGVLAPNFIRYLDRANESADIQLMDNIRSVFTTTLMDPQMMEAGTGREAAMTTSDQTIRVAVLTDGGVPQAVGSVHASLQESGNASTEFGKAIADQLGYDTVTAMLGTAGLAAELRSTHGVTGAIDVFVTTEGRVAVKMTGSTGSQGTDFDGTGEAGVGELIVD